MSVSKYLEARELIASAGGGDFEGAKSGELVASAEAALGVHFPPSYRRFLLEMGCGNIAGVEIYGLIDDDFVHSSVPDGVWLTLRKRETIGLHPAYVLIGELGDGTYEALDTRKQDRDGEAVVVQLSIDGHYSADIAQSFGEYFLERVSRML